MDKNYRCQECGSIEKGDEQKPPQCCGKTMWPLEICIQPQTAEAARMADVDEPCDDGRAG